MVIVFGFITVSSAVFAPEIGAKIAWGVLGIAICAVALRGAACRVLATETGVEVRNLFGGFSLTWQEIEHFEIGRWGLLGAVCLIQTRGGRTLHAFAIQQNNAVENLSKHPVMQLVEELNNELASNAGRSGPTQGPPAVGASL
jgi:hypothetical protein